MSARPFRLTVQTAELYPKYRYLYSFQFNLIELMETNPALIAKLQDRPVYKSDEKVHYG